MSNHQHYASSNRDRSGGISRAAKGEVRSTMQSNKGIKSVRGALIGDSAQASGWREHFNISHAVEKRCATGIRLEPGSVFKIQSAS